MDSSSVCLWCCVSMYVCCVCVICMLVFVCVHVMCLCLCDICDMGICVWYIFNRCECYVWCVCVCNVSVMCKCRVNVYVNLCDLGHPCALMHVNWSEDNLKCGSSHATLFQTASHLQHSRLAAPKCFLGVHSVFTTHLALEQQFSTFPVLLQFLCSGDPQPQYHFHCYYLTVVLLLL